MYKRFFQEAKKEPFLEIIISYNEDEEGSYIKLETLTKNYVVYKKKASFGDLEILLTQSNITFDRDKTSYHLYNKDASRTLLNFKKL